MSGRVVCIKKEARVVCPGGRVAVDSWHGRVTVARVIEIAPGAVGM